MSSNAQNMKWCMVDNGSGAKVLMNNVSFLLASDNSETFSIICNDGRIINNVVKANFEQVDATGIENVKSPDQNVAVYSTIVDNNLIISGCQRGTEVYIYSVSGKLMKKQTVKDDGTNIFIGDFSAGIYLLKAGSASVKFIKK
jgi:hypothetical protein